MQVLPRPQDMDGRPKSRLSVLIVSEMLPVGVSKSLIVNFLQTGVPSHARNLDFKGGINPKNMQQAETYAVSAIFLSKGR